MNDPAIEIDSLTVRFGRRCALQDLSLSVERGTIFGFLGENGAGKTTTLRVLMGLLRPTSGRVRVLGEEPLGGNPELLQRIGYVSDDRAMYRWMRVREILRFNGALYRGWDEAAVNAMLEEFELDPSQKIKHLSRGQLAKLALLAALAPHPELLILDEASSGLDPVVRRTILEKLITVASEEGTTIFLSSHLIEEVDRLAERIGILCRGRLVALGDKDEVRNSLRRVVLPSAAVDFHPNGHAWVLASKRTDHEVSLVVRDWSSEKSELLRNESGVAPQVLDLGLEDVFAEYTAWAKAKEGAV